MPKVSHDHLDKRRVQILDAALVCTARKGFHQTTMRDICKEAGLSIGAVYNYFQSKEDILAALTRRGRAAKDQVLRRLEAYPTARQAIVDLLRQMFAVYGDESFRTIGPVDVETYGEALRNPRVHEIANEEIHSLTDPLASMIERWQTDGQVKQGLDAVHLANYLMSVSVGIKLLVLLQPELDISKLEILVETAFLEGILANGSSSASEACDG